jgi:hypothetical protein
MFIFFLISEHALIRVPINIMINKKKIKGHKKMKRKSLGWKERIIIENMYYTRIY